MIAISNSWRIGCQGFWIKYYPKRSEVWRFYSKPVGLDLYSRERGLKQAKIIFAIVFYFFIALPLSFFSISFFLYLRFPLWKFIYLRPIYTILILIYYGVNTSQEGDKCRWRGRIDCWQWRNEWSERSVPEMKWKVAECSGMNGWTASNAGCWCGCVNEWIGMECWGTKHGMEMK